VTQPELRECPGCGRFQLVPALGPDVTARCVRCATVLRRTRVDSLSRAIALNAAALALVVILWTAMLMRVSTAGIVHDTTLLSGPSELVRQGLWPLAIAVAFTTAVAPICKHVGLIYVLLALKLRLPLPGLAVVFRFARRIGIWAMLEVLLLGVFVALTKLGDLVHMDIGPAVYALIGLTIVVVWADAALDSHEVWEEIEDQGATFVGTPVDRVLAHRDGAVGCESCGLVSVPHGHDAHGHDEHGHGSRCPRCGAARRWRSNAAAARSSTR